MRKKIIAANWKMNMTVGETEGFFKPFLLEIGSEKRADIVIVPPFTALAKAGEILRNVQNVKLSNVNITGRTVVGALIGYSTGYIANNSVTGGSVTASTNPAQASPYGTWSLVGGLVGYSVYNGGTTMTGLYNYGTTVTGASLIGGLIGDNNNGVRCPACRGDRGN